MARLVVPPYPAVIPADGDALLRLISRHVDDAMLLEIAAADYGCDVDLHLPALRQLRDDIRVPEPLVWEPREVLELIRWSEPDDPQWRPGGHRERGHWMRAFACSALLRSEYEPKNIPHRRDGANQTLAALLESVAVLDRGLEKAAAGLVAWVIDKLLAHPSSVDDLWFEDAAFFGTGLMWLISRPGLTGAELDLAGLCDWVLACEDIANARMHLGFHTKRGPFLLSTTHFNINHAKWRRLGTDLAEAELPRQPEAVRDWVRLIGALIADE